MLSCVLLVLCRVVSCCVVLARVVTRVVSCCTRVVSCRVVFCWLVLLPVLCVVESCYSCSFLDYIVHLPDSDNNRY